MEQNKMLKSKFPKYWAVRTSYSHDSDSFKNKTFDNFIFKFYSNCNPDFLSSNKINFQDDFLSKFKSLMRFTAFYKNPNGDINNGEDLLMKEDKSGSGLLKNGLGSKHRILHTQVTGLSDFTVLSTSKLYLYIKVGAIENAWNNLSFYFRYAWGEEGGWVNVWVNPIFA